MFGALFKGWIGEKATQFGLWHHLDERVYQRFHNVIVPQGHLKPTILGSDNGAERKVSWRSYAGVIGRETQRALTQWEARVGRL